MRGFRLIREAQAAIFIFPGQGSQSVGMLQELVAHYPEARAAFDEADDTLGFALSRLCFEGPEETLTDTINAQPALLAASEAILRAITSELGDTPFGISPSGSTSFVAGHSMGEYSALVASGAIGYTDGLHLLRERGRLMKEAGTEAPGMMAAILGMDQEKVAEICVESTAADGIAQIANDNCPGQVVISGDKSGMEAAMAALSSAGARKVVPLAVSIAAHCPLMAPAAKGLQAALEATTISDPQVAVLGNTTATPLTTAAQIRTELNAQLTGGVRWTESMQYALTAGVRSFFEIGPGDVVTQMIKRIDRKAKRQAVNSTESIHAFVEWFGGRHLEA